MSEVEQHIQRDREFLNQINSWVRPYQLPEDYRFFLEYYGGIQLISEHHKLFVSGIGPMVDEWYEFLMSDSAATEPGKDGFMHIADLVFTQIREGYYPRVQFMLDLAGHIQLESVIALYPRRADAPNAVTILSDPAAYKNYWKIAAPNFTIWLEHVLETYGVLGYDAFILGDRSIDEAIQ